MINVSIIHPTWEFRDKIQMPFCPKIPNIWVLSQDSQVGSPEILEIGTFTTLEAHNFLCIPLIEVRFKAKL